MSPNPHFQRQSWNVQGLQPVRRLCGPKRLQPKTVNRSEQKFETHRRMFALKRVVFASIVYVCGSASRQGAVSDFVIERHTDCSYYLTDITEIGVLRYHTCLCDSIRVWKQQMCLCLADQKTWNTLCLSIIFCIYDTARIWRAPVFLWHHYWAFMSLEAGFGINGSLRRFF